MTAGESVHATSRRRNMDATPEQLWQRIVRENPRASDKKIEFLFLDAVIDDEGLGAQILQQFFKEIRKKLIN